jgi:hypothetical protein
MPLIAVAAPLGGLAFFGWLGLRFVRAKERDAGARIENMSPGELARLQETMLAFQSELHALRERQEFVERLLERPRQDKLPG